MTQKKENGLSGNWDLVLAPEVFSGAERLLRAFLSAPNVGLAICDEQLRYYAVNHALAAMNGVSAEAHIGKTVRDILGDAAAKVEPAFEQVFLTGVTLLNFQLTAKLPARNEEGHWTENYFPLTDHSGRVKLVGAMVVEVTEQKKLEAIQRTLVDTLEQQRNERQMIVLIMVRRRLVRDFPVFLTYTVLLERQTKIFSREDLGGIHSKFVGDELAENIESLCCIPLITREGELGTLSLGSAEKGAFERCDVGFLQQVAAGVALALDIARSQQEIAQLRDKLAKEKLYWEEEIRTDLRFQEIVGESVILKRVLSQAQTVASSDATVLILGETGTGKELLARAIHRIGARKDAAFVKLNCAAIPTGLLESELFGHEKGAFTGAISQKVGRLELADKGTLFLDEVGDIPLELQPKLLRVLQDQEFERLGSTRTIRVNLRLIAATNRDLARSVAEREFRSDLYYRLNVFPIRMPSLQDRKTDIPLLVRYFVQKFARRMDRQITRIPTETMNRLVSWSWPGNVRELENFLERSVILSPGPELRVPRAELEPAQDSSGGETLEALEREHIVRILTETHGVIAGAHGAAVRLGLKRTTLQSKILRMGIAREEYQG